MRILYDSKDLKFKQPFGTLTEGQSCIIRIHIPTSCKTVSARLIFNQENGAEHASFLMTHQETQGDYDIYACQFALEARGLYFYYFRITTENEVFSLYRQGYDQTNMEAGDLWQLSCIPLEFQVPEAYVGGVMYQIFPDRFYQKGTCDTQGKLEPFWIHENKNDTPAYRPNEQGEVENCDFYGGNLRGIAEKLDYLSDLGVKILYLNPIFKAWSNHRYDTADYKKIDELLGTQEDFSRLCRMAHRRGMKIILDGVFSHTGSNSTYFQSAVSDPNSPYRSWYDFQEYPHTYTSWWGIKTLPCVNETDPAFLQYIIEDEDSVIAHWLRAGADGFRLDVADELPDCFIAKLRQRLKQIKPDAMLIGEVWEDASNKISYGQRRRYFTDGELDSVMNYPFRHAILEFICGRDRGHGLRQAVMEIAENYPPQVLSVLMNMLSTHDTPRILSLLSSKPEPITKDECAEYRMDAQERREAVARYRCASLLQFVLPGMPCVYYGDELGSEGFGDPFCRRYFDWDAVKGNEILAHIKALAGMRNRYGVLQKGDVSVEVCGDGCVCIIREYKRQICRATINTGKEIFIKNTGKILLSEKAKKREDGVLLGRYGFLCEIE